MTDRRGVYVKYPSRLHILKGILELVVYSIIKTILQHDLGEFSNIPIGLGGYSIIRHKVEHSLRVGYVQPRTGEDT